MDREILFRGKRESDGKWLYGLYSDDYVHDTDFPCIMPLRTEKDDGDWAVLRETVGQYTGLTDKNGTEIFEGDIIKIRNKTRYVFFGVCRYRHTNYGEYAVDLSVKDGSNCEVIGNIYDNPELLEVLE